MSDRARVYTESVTAKVAPEVAAKVRRSAGAAGMKPGEWARKLIEREVEGQASTTDVLAEVVKMFDVMVALAATECEEPALLRLVADAENRKRAKAARIVFEGRQG